MATFRIYTKPNIMLICLAPSMHERTISHTKERTKTAEGELSINSARKMKNAIRWLVAGSKNKLVYEKRFKKKIPWKINMITLTFHENMQDDKLARKILSQWLEMAKYRFDMQLYIWKAEPQQRGAIHFHISTNVYIPHQELRYTWNRLLRKYNLNSIEDNSTDVHAVTNIESHENYLSEYFLNEEKHAGRRKIKGKLWGCSHALSSAGKEFLLIDEMEKQEMEIDNMSISLYKKFMNEGKEIPEFLKFTDIYLTGHAWYEALPDCNLKKLYFDEIEKLRKKTKQLEFWQQEEKSKVK